MNRLTSLFALIAGLMLAQAATASPFTFSYGGRFTDNAGNGLTGSISVEVSFFRAATGGTAVISPVTINGVQLVDGIFQVSLSTLSAAEVNTVFSTSQDVWVQIKDVTHNQTLPRQSAQAIPYALKVPVDGTAISYDASGHLTLGAAASVSKISGNDVSSAAPSSGDVLAWDGSQWAPTTGGASTGVSSVNGQTGSVTLSTTNIAEGSNQYFTQARARSSLSATAPVSYNSGTGAISLPQANGSTAGYLSASDWNAFNSKQGAIANTDALAEGSSNRYYTDTRARASLSGTGPVDYDSGTGAISMAAASGSADGYLSSTDWATFNGKQNALAQASGISDGYVTSSDWLMFNAKQAAITDTTALNLGAAQFKELAANGTNFVGFKAADDVAADVTWTLPATDGGSGQMLSTNGSGTLSWVSPPSAPVSSVNGQTGAVTLSTTDVAEGSSQYFTNARARAALSATGPLSYNSGTGDFSIPAAAAGASGYLSQTDWNTFNNKQNAIANTDGLSEGSTNKYYTDTRARAALSGSAPISYNSGTGAISLSAIADTNVSGTAAIARSKLASGTANHVLINNGSGVMTSEAQLATSRGGTGVNSTATFPTSGVVVTQDSTDTLSNKTISGIVNTISNIDASQLTTGTVPDAAFPATLPAVSGANLASLNASAITSGNLKPDAFINMRQSIVMFEDFFCLSTIANCMINWTYLNTTATAVPVSSTSGIHPGLVRFSGGSGTTNYAAAVQGTATVKNVLLSATTGTITLESAISVPSAAGATMRFGLCATVNAAGTCTDGIYFLITGATTTTTVKPEVMASSVVYGPAANTSSYSAANFHNYKIVITNNTSAAFYVDGVLFDTVTTSSPYTATFPTAAMNPALKYSYVTASQNIDVDYFGYRQQFTSQR